MKILFKNARILDLDDEVGFKTGEVLVEDDTIAFVGEKYEGAVDREIDVCGNLLSPGFVNCHAHSAMTILRGVKDDVSLQEWLFDNIIPREEKLTSEDVYWGTILSIFEYLRSGTTCIQDYYFHEDGILKALNQTGIRARIALGLLTGDRTDDSYMDEQYDAIKKCPLLEPVVTAHSIYTYSEEKLSKLVAYAKKKNLPLAIHLSETLKEVGDSTVKNNGLTPPQYLEQLGFFDRKCACFHCVHMDKDDLQILKDYDVDVVTCPSSNIKLASGIAPIFAMQNKDLNISIGTDGAASNNSLDMFKEMFLVSTLSKVNLYKPDIVSARDVLKMATINGAKTVGFDKIGEIKVGNKADLILIDTKKAHMQPENNVLSNLVYSAKSSDVYLTMVNGKILYENGKFDIGFDEEEVIKKVNEIAKRIG